MNTSKATAESSEDDDRRKSKDEPSPSRRVDVEIPLLVSASQASLSHSNRTGDDASLRINNKRMKQNGRDEIPSWRENVPVITLRPRAKIPYDSGGSRRPAKALKSELFVPSLKGLDEDDDDDFGPLSPMTFMRISEPMTVVRRSSLVNRFSGSSSSCKEDDFPHVIYRSIGGSKRSWSESSSPFLSIKESSNCSTQEKKLVMVENIMLTGATDRSKEPLTPSLTPVTGVSKPQPIRRKHHPQDEEKAEQLSPGPSVKANATISLSASSAFSMTF